MNDRYNQDSSPSFSDWSYLQLHKVVALVGFLLLVFVSWFSLVGCTGNKTTTPPVIAEGVAVRFVCECGVTILTQDNIVSVDVDNTSVRFVFDSAGASNISNATSASNQGKTVSVLVAPPNGTEQVVSSPTVNNQVTNGEITISTQTAREAQELHSLVTTGYNLNYWEYFEQYGVAPY